MNSRQKRREHAVKVNKIKSERKQRIRHEIFRMYSDVCVIKGKPLDGNEINHLYKTIINDHQLDEWLYKMINIIDFELDG